ncbi:MAG: plasmid pRiA4b ORF-3 family protein, partial [Pseudomonadota bacterium]
MTTTRLSPSARIYRLKVCLLSHLGIWRGIEVPGDYTLRRLHFVIQDAMGWGNHHPHEFTVKRVRYTEPCDELADFFAAGELRSEYEVKLADVARRKGARFSYLYDFGDMWRHEVLVEAIHPPEPGV